MEPTPLFYDKSSYIETLTGNKVSRASILCGSRNIRLSGKTVIKEEAVLRGDLANVNIGKHSLVAKRTVLRPSYKRYKGFVTLFTL